MQINPQHHPCVTLARGEMLKNEKLAEIAKSAYYAVLCDETTDITISEQLITYIKYFDTNQSKTRVTFLAIDEVKSCKSDEITAKLLEVLARENLPAPEDRMAGFGSDGAANMVGKHNGVATQLKRVSPILVANHCVAHRLALAVGGASKDVPIVTKFNDTLESLYNFYENSTIRTAGLKAIQDALDENEGNTQPRRTTAKPKRARTTRWLSHDHACTTMAAILPAVIMSLQREAAERGDAKAVGLDRLVEQWSFVACLYLMLDILPQLSILSRCFQESSLDFQVIQVHVKTTVDLLEARLVIPGDNFKKIEKAFEEIKNVAKPEMNVPTKEELKNFKIKVFDKFVAALIDNIKGRFPHVGLLKALNIFNPKNVPAAREELDEYGQEELQDIIQQYSRILGTDEDVELEWASFRSVLASTTDLRTMDTVGVLVDLMKPGYRPVYPNLQRIAAATLVIPMSTADCERGFSALKRIKTRLRASLSAKVLNSLMFVATEGPERLSDQQLDEVARLWDKMFQRQISLNLPAAPTLPEALEID